MPIRNLLLLQCLNDVIGHWLDYNKCPSYESHFIVHTVPLIWVDICFTSCWNFRTSSFGKIALERIFSVARRSVLMCKWERNTVWLKLKWITFFLIVWFIWYCRSSLFDNRRTWRLKPIPSNSLPNVSIARGGLGKIKRVALDYEWSLL